MLKSVVFAILTTILVTTAVVAQASCPNPVSTPINLFEGGPAIHLSVHDQNCTQITPVSSSQFSIASGGLSGCSSSQVGMASASPAPTKVVATPDNTGVSLQAASGATGMASCGIVINFTDGSLVVSSGIIPITVTSGVTAVNIESP
jgi:hypothetical protein